MSNTDTLIKQTQEQGKSRKLEHKCYLCGYKIPEKEVIPGEHYDICNQCEPEHKCYLCGYKIPEKEVIPDEPYDICNQCEASYL